MDGDVGWDETTRSDVEPAAKVLVCQSSEGRMPASVSADLMPDASGAVDEQLVADVAVMISGDDLGEACFRAEL